MRLSRRARKGIRAFTRVQQSPTKVRYTLRRKMGTDVLVAAYYEVKK